VRSSEVLARDVAHQFNKVKAIPVSQSSTDHTLIDVLIRVYQLLPISVLFLCRIAKVSSFLLGD
jgi:hypothetical protein